MPCGGPKKSPVHRFSVVIFIFFGPLGLWDSRLFFESREAFNPGLGGVRDVTSAIICHEQTQFLIFAFFLLSIKPSLLFSSSPYLISFCSTAHLHRMYMYVIAYDII